MHEIRAAINQRRSKKQELSWKLKEENVQVPWRTPIVIQVNQPASRLRERRYPSINQRQLP